MLNLFKQTRNGAALAFGGLLSAGWYISANSLLSGTAMHSLAVAGAIVIAGITPMWVSTRAMAKRASSQNRSLSQRLMAFDRHVLVNVVDTQGKLTEVNDQMLQVTGYALDTLVGQPVSMLYADNEGHNLAHAISKCLRRGETWQGETPLRCADGRVIVTHSTIIPLFDSKGKWTGSIAARTDITRMMKLLGEHETIETLDELRDDIWILDADTQNFTYMNKSALSRLKWSHDSLREQGIRDIAPLEGADDLVTACDQMRHDSQNLAHTEVVLAGITFAVTIKFLQVGNQADRFLFVLNDISERLAEERTKSDFISMVSHELRSPLTSIKGSMGLLLSKAAGDIPEKAQALLEIAHRNADRLVLIINDILDLEKISTGRMEFETTIGDLCDLIRESDHANEMLLQRYGLQIETAGTDHPILLETDHNRVMQVLNNLISNACKFSPPGGKVHIIVQEGTNEVKISVKDHGTGIPEGDQHKIFQRFADLQNSDRAIKGGTGLGLSICKAIVESLGGRIGFETREGKGTEFYFVLPISQGLGNEELAVSEMREAS